MCMVWVGMAMQIPTLQPPPGTARLGPILMNQVHKLLYYSKDPYFLLSIRNRLEESWTPWLLFKKTADIFVEDYLYQ